MKHTYFMKRSDAMLNDAKFFRDASRQQRRNLRMRKYFKKAMRASALKYLELLKAGR